MSTSPRPSVFLGFDFGSKRIGVAVGDDLSRSARPLATVAASDAAALAKLMQEWQPAACIVGLPLGEDGGEQPASAAARAFARSLAQRFKIAVHLCDERMSSIAADAALKAARGRGHDRRRVKGDQDSAAAALVLEQWLNERRT